MVSFFLEAFSMCSSLNHFLVAIAATASSGVTTSWAATNEDTAAIAEIYLCFLVAIMMAAAARP
jgi:hypothetical protein